MVRQNAIAAVGKLLILVGEMGKCENQSTLLVTIHL